MNKKSFIFYGIIIAVLIIIILFLLFIILEPKSKKVSSNLKITKNDNTSKFNKNKENIGLEKTSFLLLKSDNSVNKISLYISKDGICAIPTALLLNYQNLFIMDKNGTSYSLDSYAYWKDGMPFVLIITPLKGNFTNYFLGFYDPNASIYIENNNTKLEYKPTSIIEKSIYYEFNVENQKDSIIYQNGKIVGWVFGEESKAYLLKKFTISSEMTPNISLGLVSILANKEEMHEIKMDPLDESNYSKIIGILSYFENNNSSVELQNDIINLITITIKKAEQEKAYPKILSLLPPDLLIKTKSEFFLNQLSIALKNSYGFDGAISCLNNFLIMNKFPENLKKRDNEIILNLYIEYIETCIKEHNLTMSLQVYNTAIVQFPYNPKLLLLGSEIYFALNDIKSAKETLLKIKESDITDRYTELLNKINEKLVDQNKIIAKIEENDHSNIVLSGILNGSIYQKFILDTGASIVTLPSSTANALGLYNLPYRTRTIATASGVVQAREVILHSLTINGKITYDIPVVILDLPEQEGLGLLGMSFLRRFHIELNGQQKELLLTPVEE